MLGGSGLCGLLQILFVGMRAWCHVYLDQLALPVSGPGRLFRGAAVMRLQALLWTLLCKQLPLELGLVHKGYFRRWRGLGKSV